MTQQAYAPAYGPAPEWHGPPQEWYDPTPPPKPTSWWKRRWIWWTAIIVAAVVAGSAGASVAYNTHQHDLQVAHEQQVAAQAAEQARQAAEQAAAAQAALEAAQAALADQVKTSIQATLDSDSYFTQYHLVVTQVKLVPQSGFARFM